VLAAGVAAFIAMTDSTSARQMQAPPPYSQALKDLSKELGQPPRAPANDTKLLGVDAFPCANEQQQDVSVWRSCLSARQAYYEYYAAGLARRTRVYEWNNVSTRVIFGMVLVLVWIGMYFSWKQFFGVTKMVGQAVELAPAERARADYTELEASFRGLKVRSPVLGVVLLVVSLAFFYLYLLFVYPVTEQF
jgi:hypothetical protein